MLNNSPSLDLHTELDTYRTPIYFVYAYLWLLFGVLCTTIVLAYAISQGTVLLSTRFVGAGLLFMFIYTMGMVIVPGDSRRLMKWLWIDGPRNFITQHMCQLVLILCLFPLGWFCFWVTNPIEDAPILTH